MIAARVRRQPTSRTRLPMASAITGVNRYGATSSKWPKRLYVEDVATLSTPFTGTNAHQGLEHSRLPHAGTGTGWTMRYSHDNGKSWKSTTTGAGPIRLVGDALYYSSAG
jgi:hypothetical protein